jgi:hypothetical protein
MFHPLIYSSPTAVELPVSANFSNRMFEAAQLVPG